MAYFEQKQIESLRGHYTVIARSCGVTSEYVKLVLTGKRKSKSKKAQEIVKKSKAIISILSE